MYAVFYEMNDDHAQTVTKIPTSKNLLTPRRKYSSEISGTLALG